MSGTNSNRTSDDRTDKVLGVAIERHGLVFSMRKPARHHDVIKAMVEQGVPAPIGPGQGFTQGFLTSHGYKDRYITGKLIGHEGLLTSEDLW